MHNRLSAGKTDETNPRNDEFYIRSRPETIYDDIGELELRKYVGACLGSEKCSCVRYYVEYGNGLMTGFEI